MDDLANKQTAIFINNILLDMHLHSFFISTQFEDILNCIYCDCYLHLFTSFMCYVPRVRSINSYNIIIIIISRIHGKMQTTNRN